MKAEYASHLPSGDHLKVVGVRSTCVSCNVSRVSSHMMWSCVVPSRSERNAIRLPSGEKTGAESRQGPLEISRRRVPAVSVIQRPARSWSLILSTYPRLKTIWEPSGEIWGAVIDSISMKVSLSRSLGFCAAARGRASAREMTKKRWSRIGREYSSLGWVL